MATKAVLEKHLICPICLDIFKRPKSLPCCHTFCESCLHDYICSSKIEFTRNGPFFECPVCRKHTHPINTSTHISQWAKELPSNHFIVSVMEETFENTAKRNSEYNNMTHSELRCVPCIADRKQSHVFAFCINCIEHLCKNCYYEHKRFKVTRNHNILQGSDMPTDVGLFERMSSLSLCPVHPDREVEFRCSYHGNFICPMCLRDAHRYCSQLEPIQKKTRQRETNSCYSEYINELKAVKKASENVLSSTKKTVDNVTYLESTVEANRCKIVDRLKTVTMFLENDFPKQFNEFIESEKAILSVNDATGCNLIKNVTADLNLVEILLKNGSEVQVAVYLDKLKTDLKKKNEELLLLQESSRVVSQKKGTVEKVETRVKVMENAVDTVIKLDELLKGLIVDGIERANGKNEASGDSVEKHSDPSEEKPDKLERDVEKMEHGRKSEVDQGSLNNAEPLFTNPGQNVVESDSDELSEPNYLDCVLVDVGEHNIYLPLPNQMDSDADCYFSGSVLLPNGNMVFINRFEDTITLVHSSFYPVFAIGIEDTPLDIALLNDDAVAVAIDKAVCIYQVHGDELVRRQTFKTRGIINSITSIDNNLAILFSDANVLCQDVSIQIRSDDNKIIAEIEDFCNLGNDKYDLSEPRVLRSRKSDEFILAEGREVVAFDRSGDMKWYYKRKYLKDIENISFDSQNNIYVCDADSETVHQIVSYSYKRSRVIISGNGRPCSVLFNPVDQTLVVGYIGDRNVHVYQFQ